MPYKARIRPKSIKELLRPLFSFPVALMFIVIAILTIQAWTGEPSAEAINKRRAIINKQVTEQLNDCMAGNVKVIVGLHNCRPLKNHKSAVIWGR